MRLRIKVRLKAVGYILAISLFFLLISVFDHKGEGNPMKVISRSHLKVASINAEDISTIRRSEPPKQYPDDFLASIQSRSEQQKLNQDDFISPLKSTNNEVWLEEKNPQRSALEKPEITIKRIPMLSITTKSCGVHTTCFNITFSSTKKSFANANTGATSKEKSQDVFTAGGPNTEALLEKMLKLYKTRIPIVFNISSNPDNKLSTVDLDIDLPEFIELSLRKASTDLKQVVSYLIVFQDELQKEKNCKNDCTGDVIKQRKGYASRVIIESITLPTVWSASNDLARKLKDRKDNAKKVCHKYGLDKRTPNNQPNAWEFLINTKYNLVWCSVFKAASSTWFYNFNILAGYSDKYLLTAKETPISLARKKYPRPTLENLDQILNSTNHPLTFMIARHPLERLISAYRDKLQTGTRFYRNVAKKIMSTYPDLGPTQQVQFVYANTSDTKHKAKFPRYGKKSVVKYVGPSFQQFVQYVIDSEKKGALLDEHWVPMYRFCSPCLVDYDVIAKVETLDEDGNYVIFNSGIQNLIKPKRINRSRNEPTDAVALSYLCQLTRAQMKDLIEIYKIDMEIFGYSYEKYLNCPSPG